MAARDVRAKGSWARSVQWSPSSPNQFAVTAEDVRVYDIGAKDAPGDASRKINVVSTWPAEIQNPRCATWCPAVSHNVLAVGMATGNILLTRPSATPDVTPENICEYVPPVARPCTSLAWNPAHVDHLAAGYDKVKFEFCGHVWDVNLMDLPSARGRDARTMQVTKPIASLAPSEGTTALEWVPNMSKCILVGTSFKWLRLYDLRDVTQPRSLLAHTRSVNGVVFDPFNAARLATFSEDGTIKTWDMRKFVSPLVTIETGSQRLCQIRWSPLRAGVLASISTDEAFVKLWDVDTTAPKVAAAGFDEAEARSKVELKPRLLRTAQTLLAFAWNPALENRMITVNSLGAVEEVSLHELMAVSWSPLGDLAFSYGKGVRAASLDIRPKDASDGAFREEEDIAVVMRSRAQRGYGLDARQNLPLLEFEDSGARFLWEWMLRVSELPEAEPGKSLRNFEGILAIFSTAETSTVEPPREGPLQFSVYTSTRRHAALQICGWAYDVESRNALAGFMELLEEQQQWEKVAAIALFHLDLRRAIDALRRATTTLKLVAMAFAGYTGQRDGAWREMCTTLRSQFDHPYLRAAFAFLSNDTPDFSGVLNENGITITDRVAFACRFLPDTELNNFLLRMAEDLKAKGRLEGVLLTGLSSNHGVALFSEYVARTSDVQTACLAMCAVVPRLYRHDRVSRWIETYRGLLDQWQLWHHRAKFDVARLQDTEPHLPAEVHARCNFCNNPLSHSMISKSVLQSYGAVGRSGPVGRRRPKVTSCPSCRKPLPKCSLCLLPLEITASASTVYRNRPRAPPMGGERDGGDSLAKMGPQPGSSNFDNWFTWCQSCRHGGHAAHVMEWFATHSQCPVSDCTCMCSRLDAAAAQAGDRPEPAAPRAAPEGE